MNLQTELWDIPAPKPANQRLFVGILPDPAIAARVHKLAEQIKVRHSLPGRIRPLSHLHITLRWIDDYPEIPKNHIRDVKEACKAAASVTAPFQIGMDRVLSWGNGVGKHPVVLTGHGDQNDALLSFQQALWKQLILCGHSGRGGRDFTPHITLLYDDGAIPTETVPPILWEAKDFVLIHSEVGSTKYTELGRWAFM